MIGFLLLKRIYTFLKTARRSIYNWAKLPITMRGTMMIIELLCREIITNIAKMEGHEQILNREINFIGSR